MTVVSSAERGDQPGITSFCELLFGEHGAWRFMQSFDGFGARPIEAPGDVGRRTPATALERPHMRVNSVAVPHGPMPSVAYQIELDERTIVFSGDIETDYPPLVELAAGCDVLVHSFAVPERDVEQSHLLARPSAVGRVARDCGCDLLVLTHVFPLLENELNQVHRAYHGPLIVAEDAMRIVILAAVPVLGRGPEGHGAPDARTWQGINYPPPRAAHQSSVEVALVRPIDESWAVATGPRGNATRGDG